MLPYLKLMINRGFYLLALTFCLINKTYLNTITLLLFKWNSLRLLKIVELSENF